MVDQLLFGESFQVLDVDREWLSVEARPDGYRGWVQASLCVKLPRDSEPEAGLRWLSSGFLGLAEFATDSLPVNLVMGSELRHFKPERSEGFLAGRAYRFEGDSELFGAKSSAFAAEAALDFLHAPYLWGGRSVWGIDCSGLVQIAFKLAGRDLPRDAHQQAELGTVLGFVDEAEPGDLAFFHNEEGKIVHVGIMLGDHRILHASGRVRIDHIDQTGIYQPEIKRHTHALRFLKRLG